MTDVLALVDLPHYRAEAGLDFADSGDALDHYLAIGAGDDLDPHPLFDTSWYREANPDAAGQNPLVHFVTAGADEGRDPSPWFDVGHYVGQARGRVAGNPVAHYCEYGPSGRAPNPNPLFGNGYYLAMNDDVRADGANPFAHYLGRGVGDGRYASQLHQQVMETRRRRAGRLVRGRPADGQVVLAFGGGDRPLAPAVHDALATHCRRDARVVFVRRPAVASLETLSDAIVLEDHEEPGLLRPAALRLFARALTATGAALVVTDVPELLPGFAATDVPTYFLAVEDDRAAEERLDEIARAATRVVFGSGRRARHAPANTATRPYETDGDGAAAFAGSVLALAERDLRHARRDGHGSLRRLRVVCSDWSVSGVNTALEAMSAQLARRGWDVEILFTREERFVRESAGGALPPIRHRFLEPAPSTVEGVWEGLIAELEAAAPCVAFLAYDFVANSVVPALTDRVAAVMWTQADDGDYYEQAYRLGRYCNAIVCVSQHIATELAALHPGLAERAVVIHNTSVGERDIADVRAPEARELRIAYSGRLVQYQKRILDFVDLADALDRRSVPYRITLAGSFSAHDAAAAAFPRRAADHLERGTIELAGRLGRGPLLDLLRTQDFFALLSDFEGLPLSLVEAMACGCVPVVAEMRSGISELVSSGENGVVMRGRDYDEWAERIVSLWRDRARLVTMSQRARDRIRTDFTVERLADRFDHVFSRALEDVTSGVFTRPPALHWGEIRAPTGDVLPPPSMYRSVRVPGLA
jgi:glycosyltransferase involved in cell wall biosynthesis